KELSPMNKGLVKGEAKALSGAIREPFKEHKNSISIDYFDLPVSAGTGVYLDNCYKGKIDVELTELSRHADYVLRVSGNSMEPNYHNEDLVLICSQPTINLGEIGIFVLNGEGYVKKLGKDRLISLNSDYDDIIFSENDSIYCMGKVMGVV
ncbi:MAG: helix-turn-helix transcriptional regulator, partial [Ruminococcus sp.]|nr:helix-turn-helix transcriptional regulator [Ruminococcus sp.]